MSKPDVAIIIPCLNEEAYIGKCLDSALAQDYPSDQIRIFVVDGGSNDGTLEILKRYSEQHPQIVHVHNPQKVTPVSLNLGIKTGNASVSIILGAHAELYPDFVRRNVGVLEAHPEVGCAGGVIENVYENPAARRIGLAMGSAFGVGNAHFRTGRASGYVDTVAFGAYRKEVFEKVGYFDEALVRNQDDEFNFRVLKAGFRIWLDPEIRSKYFVRGSYSKLFRQYFQYGYWKVYVNSMHGTVTSLRQLAPPLFVAGIFTGLALSFLHKIFAVLWFGGLALYAFGAMYAAASTQAKPKELPGVIWSFVILHTAYGSGYLEGILHVNLMGKKPGRKQSELTR